MKTSKKNFRMSEMAFGRLHRLMRLREMKVSPYFIKYEQVAMVCNRKGFKGSNNKLATELFNRHVLPLLDAIDKGE